MTDPQIIPSPISRGRGGKQSSSASEELEARLSPQALATIEKALFAGADVAYLIDKQSLEPPTDAEGLPLAESTSSTSLLERVAKAIVLKSLHTEDMTETDISAAMAEIGVPPQLYEQVALHPDFDETLARYEYIFVHLPRRTRLINSTHNMGMHGDAKTAMRILEQSRPNQEIADLVRQKEAGGEGAMRRDLEIVKLQIDEMLGMMENTQVDQAKVDEAVARVSDPRAGMAEDEPSVDVRALRAAIPQLPQSDEHLTEEFK